MKSAKSYIARKEDLGICSCSTKGGPSFLSKDFDNSKGVLCMVVHPRRMRQSARFSSPGDEGHLTLIIYFV
jgi:hypothetical protein